MKNAKNLQAEEKSFSILGTINSPGDLKNMKESHLPEVARELREYIIRVVSENGGHLASNLGVVELTMALHLAFESPVDKIIWDVGHQCYAHKILTGRRDNFPGIRQLGGLSGFPKTSESKHDIIETGHSSTSISTGLGVLLGQNILKQKGKVIAVIGDGSLTGGVALEGLNQAGHLKKDLVIVLNDNEMSISPNVGALSSYLSRLTATHFYQRFQRGFDRLLQNLPFIGKGLLKLLLRLKKGVKAVVLRETLFSDLGFEYVGPIDGHNLSLMVDVFHKVKDISKPVVVHVVTRKGKGYSHAEGDPALFHGVGAFNILDGKVERKSYLTFTDAFSRVIVKLGEEDSRVAAITAAMTSGTGLNLFKSRFPERFFDVGITEQHASSFAAGLATAGIRPVVAVYSSFMQRAVDQVIHDVALPGLPVIFCMDRAGLVGNDGETHQGVFDIPLFRNVPGISFLAPANDGEMEQMLRYALKKGTPTLLRYPKGISTLEEEALNAPLVEGRGVLISRGGETLVICTGGILNEALKAADQLGGEKIPLDIYNLRFIKPLDEDYLIRLIGSYSYVVSVEDGTVSGGMGEKIQSLLLSRGVFRPFAVLGVEDRFINHGSREELLELCGYDAKGIALCVRKLRSRGAVSAELKLV